jgi:hypothetical protein
MTRMRNWQKFCLQVESVLAFLFKISFSLDDCISLIILQLLQGSLCSQAMQLFMAATSPAASKARPTCPGARSAT